MIFISPPFGNYIHLPNTTPIRGSFTLNERPGKWGQILNIIKTAQRTKLNIYFKVLSCTECSWINAKSK